MLNNSVMGLALSGVLLALSYWVWRVNRKGALIAFCHNGIWIAALLLVATDLIRYDRASPTAWGVLATSLVMFNVGVVIGGYVRFPRHAAADTSRAFMPVQPLALMGRRVFFVLFGVYAAAFLGYLGVQWMRVGDIAVLLNPSAIRDIDGVSNLEATPIFIRAVFYMGPLLFAVLAFKEGMRNPLPLALRLLGALVVLGTMVALLQRTNLFLSVLVWLALVVTRYLGTKPAEAGRSDKTPAGNPPIKTRSLSPIKLGVFAIVAVLLMFGTFQVLAVTLGKNGSQALSTGNVSPVLERSGLTSIFTYYTGGVPAFLQLVDSNDESFPPDQAANLPQSGEYNPTLWGASTFGPVLRLIPGFSEWNPIEPFIDMGIAINVYTWNGPIYRDFRVVGVGVVMLLTGALISFLHAERFRSARVFWLQAALLSGVFLSTFASVTQWGNIMIVFYLAIFALTLKRIRPPKQRATLDSPIAGETTNGSATS